MEDKTSFAVGLKRKILFAVCVLFGVMMINSGLNKFFDYMPLPEMNEAATKLMMAFKESGWLIPLVAIAEIVGGALLILPRTRALGAVILFPIVIGIFLFHAILEPASMAISVVLLIIIAFILYNNRDKYRAMIS